MFGFRGLLAVVLRPLRQFVGAREVRSDFAGVVRAAKRPSGAEARVFLAFSGTAEAVPFHETQRHE